ncbi:hypothetical protein DFH94DRAFT_678002 [Russula ochroleuca]|uniref:Uncharacterized protein n=1 Tax=Russula ochroleuca TaxID=152965 RepID=A0A9P5N5N3_9AGAM|nr:hypothetical protein DFH94DRAFT_678002 [Russula ochroleuca]
MPPINTRKQKLKGTHCFEMTISRFWDNEAVCSITLDCNSLTTCSDAAAGHFYAIPYDRISLLGWTQTHPAPPNTCVVVPWSAWGPSAARVVAPCIDDSDIMYMCPSQSRFSGCGMRIISALSVRSDGTTTVTVTDYHPARVFRGRKQEVQLEKAPVTHVPQTVAKMRYLQKDIQLPKEFRLNTSVFTTTFQRVVRSSSPKATQFNTRIGTRFESVVGHWKRNHEWYVPPPPIGSPAPGRPPSRRLNVSSGDTFGHSGWSHSTLIMPVNHDCRHWGPGD